jgi:hypothetical protein
MKLSQRKRVKSKAKSEGNGFVYFAVGVAALGGPLFGYEKGLFRGRSGSLKISFPFRSHGGNCRQFRVGGHRHRCDYRRCFHSPLWMTWNDLCGRHYFYSPRPRHGPGPDGAWLIAARLMDSIDRLP